jgi:phage terminase large subunit-like protein
MDCAMGMDASQGDDFWAFSWLFPLSGGRMGVKVRSYITKRKYMKQPSATRQKYDELIEEGTLIIQDSAILDWEEIFEDVIDYMFSHDWNVVAFGYDPYNAAPFVERWCNENGEYGVVKVRQGVRTESVPLGEMKALATDRMLIFDEETMKFSMGNAIVIQDNNGNFKLSKKRSEDKIDNVASTMDALVAFKENKEQFI